MAFHKKDRFGRLKDPRFAVENFAMAQMMGVVPKNQDRKQADAHYHKKLRKKRLAKAARRKNRR